MRFTFKGRGYRWNVATFLYNLSIIASVALFILTMVDFFNNPAKYITTWR